MTELNPSSVAQARMSSPVLQLQHVSKTFHAHGREPVHAVRDVTLSVGRGETVAIVGESGSGKSTLGRIALGLQRPDEGKVLLDGQALADLSRGEFQKARIAMQPIFQDPTASFNPRRPVLEALLQAQRPPLPAEPKKRAQELLERVGLPNDDGFLARLPHELSGGQRQRLAIARAISMEPVLIIADEPLSGADVSIRGQVLNLLSDLQRESGVAYLMITHDISIAGAFAHRVAVMMGGVMVENGRAADLLTAPQHPYTQRLMASVPAIHV